jgi:hypothetical protein
MSSPNAVGTLSQQSSSSASSNSIGASPAVAMSPNATGVLSVTQQLSSGTTNDRVSPLIFLSYLLMLVVLLQAVGHPLFLLEELLQQKC